MAQVPKLIGVKIKITDVKIQRLKLIKEAGVFNVPQGLGLGVTVKKDCIAA